MKKVNDFRLVGVYETGIENFLVDIVQDKKEELFEAWLYRRDNGDKQFMFGTSDNLIEFKQLVIDNLYQYCKTYDSNIEKN